MGSARRRPRYSISWLVRSIGFSGPDNINIEAVFDAPGVWAALGEVIVAPPPPPSSGDDETSLIQIAYIRALAVQRNATMFMDWTVGRARVPVDYVVSISYDDWATFEEVHRGPASSGSYGVRETEGFIKARAYAVSRSGLRSNVVETQFRSPKPIITGETGDIRVDLEELFGQARKNVEEIARIGENTIRGEIKRLNDKLEELAAASATEAGNAFEKREFYKVVLEGGLTQNFAAIEEERIARIDAVDGVITATAAVTTALGTRLTNAETYLVADAIAIQSLTTTVTSHGSTLSSQSNAITSLQSTITHPVTGLAATATATSQLKTRVDDSKTGLIALSESITVLDSATKDNSATLTRYGYSKSGTEVRYGIVGTINGVSGGLVMTGVRKLDGSVSFGIEITGNLIVAGAISGAHLQTHSIITNSAQIGSLIVDHISVKDGAITNSAAASTAGSIVNVVIAVRATGKVHISATFNGAPGQYSSFLLPGVLQVSRAGVGAFKLVGTAFEASGSGGSAGIALLPTSLIALDAPGAGVHTYTVETTNGLGIGGVTIVVQELSK